MAEATFTLAPPVEQPVESFTLTLTPEEAAVVYAFIGELNDVTTCERVCVRSMGRLSLEVLDLPASGRGVKDATSLVYTALEKALTDSGRVKNGWRY